MRWAVSASVTRIYERFRTDWPGKGHNQLFSDFRSSSLPLRPVHSICVCAFLFLRLFQFCYLRIQPINSASNNDPRLLDKQVKTQSLQCELFANDYSLFPKSVSIRRILRIVVSTSQDSLIFMKLTWPFSIGLHCILQCKGFDCSYLSKHTLTRCLTFNWFSSNLEAIHSNVAAIRLSLKSSRDRRM